MIAAESGAVAAGVKVAHIGFYSDSAQRTPIELLAAGPTMAALRAHAGSEVSFGVLGRKLGMYRGMVGCAASATHVDPDRCLPLLRETPVGGIPA